MSLGKLIRLFPSVDMIRNFNILIFGGEWVAKTNEILHRTVCMSKTST
jgi:hypothetical protein